MRMWADIHYVFLTIMQIGFIYVCNISHFLRRSFRWFKEDSDLDGEFRVTDACQLEDLDVLSQVANNDNFVNPVRTLPSMLQASYSARRRDQGGDPGNGPISVDLEVDTSISYA